MGRLICTAIEAQRWRQPMAAAISLEREAQALRTISIPVEGMSCASCVGHVEKAISKLPGVTGANVNLATERADVSFAGRPDPAAVVQAVEGAGYSVPEEALEIGIEGMTCACCASHVGAGS